MTVIRHHLNGYLDAKKAKKTIEWLYHYDSEYPDSDWEFVISSFGGEMEAGNSIYSELYSYSARAEGGHLITTKVRGMAGSAASLIFQAGDIRVGGRMDAILLHQPMFSCEDMTLPQVKNYVERCEQWVERYTDICLARSPMSRSEFQDKIAHGDWVLYMDEAIEYGLCDRLA